MIIDKNLMLSIFNSNEFKGWLLSRRWFGFKTSLSNLDFNIDIENFELIGERILLSIIKIEYRQNVKHYFLPMVVYDEIEDILDSAEIQSTTILKLTENTFSKKIAVTQDARTKIILINLVEAEYCLYFWKFILFDKTISESFPIHSLKLSLYEDQFRDDTNMKRVQQLIEASLYPNRYRFSLEQLGKGDTTNLLFKIELLNTNNNVNIQYVLKSYKECVGSLEPSMLFILVKNAFSYAPKIYGTIEFFDKEIIGISEYVANIGNLGDIYWKEVNSLVSKAFKKVKSNFLSDSKEEISALVKNVCSESLKISNSIGKLITNLHNNLIYDEEDLYKLETVESDFFLRNYSQKLNFMLTELQKTINSQSESYFYSLPKISSLLIDVLDIIEKLRIDYTENTIKIQMIHQNLHMGQILINKANGSYEFCFIDFEGDPELNQDEKRTKFPIERDLASFLRSLSYIKFNTLLNLIQEHIVRQDKFEVPEEILYTMFFRKTVSVKSKALNYTVKVLDYWERKLIRNFLKDIKFNVALINYFTVERALNELNYEVLFRPAKIIVPILGLKEIIEKS